MDRSVDIKRSEVKKNSNTEDTERTREKTNGDVHLVKCSQLLDLKEILFLPRPITVNFLRLLSWEIEKKAEGISMSPPPFFVCT